MRAGIRPDAIIAAAAELADRSGWQEVTLGNVAGQLGIKTPSLYNHVEGLHDLRQRLASYALLHLRARMYDAAVGQAGREALIEVARAYVDFARRHPGLYEAVNRVSTPKPADFEQAAQQILELFIRLMQPLDIPHEEAVHAVRGIRSIVHGFASLEAMGGFQMDVDRDVSLTKIIAYFFDGLDKSPR